MTRKGSQIDGAALCQDRPDDPCQLVGQSDDGFVAMGSGFQGVQPTPQGMALAVQMQKAGSRPMDDQAAHISVCKRDAAPLLPLLI
jgi:hypothetical protein